MYKVISFFWPSHPGFYLLNMFLPVTVFPIHSLDRCAMDRRVQGRGYPELCSNYSPPTANSCQPQTQKIYISVSCLFNSSPFQFTIIFQGFFFFFSFLLFKLKRVSTESVCSCHDSWFTQLNLREFELFLVSMLLLPLSFYLSLYLYLSILLYLAISLSPLSLSIYLSLSLYPSLSRYLSLFSSMYLSFCL